MKMVKQLLLGTAAGMIAVAGAQAADMPVKAKPVEYVKICTLYGAGFYYIPGTDTCIKIGGYVRVQTDLHGGGGGVVDGSGPQMTNQARFTRDLTNDINYRVRGVISMDARTQTDYGTLRSYFRAGWENTTPNNTGGGTTANPFWDRAFIQFAGFTVGRAQSFYDGFTFGGAYSYLNVREGGDTGATGQNLWAYTVQFGNGVSYSVSLEDPATKRGAVVDNTCANFFGNTAPVSDAAHHGQTACGTTGQFGFRVPDIITNLRVDQAWGYVGVSTAIHEASGAYYGTPNNINNGHPADKYGWAVSAFGLLNLQGGDIIGVNFSTGRGAVHYTTNSSWWQYYENSNSRAMGWVADGIFGTGTDVELTESWSVVAGYQHIWGAAGTFGGKWRTSLYGGYVSIHYNDRATQLINQSFANGVCNGGAGTGVLTTFNPQAGNSCNPDVSWYQVGSRTQFNPAPLMDIGLDVFYTKINSAYEGPVNWVANGSRPACTNSAILGCDFADKGTLTAIVRWQRNFYP
ncbi:MAG: porin [Xanthobacteraceae bacterium]